MTVTYPDHHHPARNYCNSLLNGLLPSPLQPSLNSTARGVQVEPEWHLIPPDSLLMASIALSVNTSVFPAACKALCKLNESPLLTSPSTVHIPPHQHQRPPCGPSDAPGILLFRAVRWLHPLTSPPVPQRSPLPRLLEVFAQLSPLPRGHPDHPA